MDSADVRPFGLFLDQSLLEFPRIDTYLQVYTFVCARCVRLGKWRSGWAARSFVIAVCAPVLSSGAAPGTMCGEIAFVLTNPLRVGVLGRVCTTCPCKLLGFPCFRTGT